MIFTIALYIVIFFVFLAIHLYASHIKRDSLRAPTKTVLLLAILGMYLEWSNYFNIKPSVFVILALVTSWLGDVLLIPKGVKWFTAGGIAFWISHFLFIYSYYESGVVFSNINPVLIVAIAAIYFVVVTFLFTKLKKSLPKALFYPMYLYLLTNGAMNAFAWFRLLSGSVGFVNGLVTGIGALLFFISDSTLFFVRFDKSWKDKSHFLVMLTYSIGEFMIIAGLIGLGIPA